MKKLKFEWWWLWIPVVVFSFFKMMDFNKSSLFLSGLYFSLFLLASLGIGFRPRKPTVIYSHLNTMLRHFYWIVSGAALVLLWSAFGQAASGLDLPAWLDFVLFLSVIVLMGLSVAYVLDWSLPYSRKRSGVAAVDAAIERYRKPDELVGGAWVAPVVIDGKRYRMVVYRGKGTKRYKSNDEPLALDENGAVVRDLELMNKVLQGNRLAWNVSNPVQINFRTSGYKDLGKFPVLLARALKKFPKWEAVLGARRAKDLQALKRALLVIGEYMRLQREAYYREAQWGAAHGNARLKEVPYEEVAKLNDELKPYQVFYQHFDVMKQGVEAAERLSRALNRQWELARQVKDLKYVLHLLLEARERVEKAEENIKAGKQETYYDGLSAAEESAWRARLAWVDVVDSWVTQGLTGEALEAKKAEYLAEQARLER